MATNNLTKKIIQNHYWCLPLCAGASCAFTEVWVGGGRGGAATVWVSCFLWKVEETKVWLPLTEAVRMDAFCSTCWILEVMEGWEANPGAAGPRSGTSTWGWGLLLATGCWTEQVIHKMLNNNLSFNFSFALYRLS